MKNINEKKTRSIQESKKYVYEGLSSGNHQIRKSVVKLLTAYFSKDQFEVKNFANVYGATGNISFKKLIETRPVFFKKFYKSFPLNKTSIFALNIYDVRKNSFDISSLLENSIKFNSPCIAQVSLNAAYGVSDSEKHGLIPGYLNLKNGSVDFINTVLDEAIKARFLYPSDNLLIYGIGLDHVGGRHDQNRLSAIHFLRQALATNNLTHVTVDGSHLVKKGESIDRYDEAIKYIFKLIGEGCNGLDIEICVGELDYHDSESVPIPTAEDIEKIALRFNQMAQRAGLEWLREYPKLFVANLGSKHHSLERQYVDTKLLAKWTERVIKFGFYSPVLHGTTGLDYGDLRGAVDNGCLKINLAGQILHKIIMNKPEGFENIFIKSDPKYDIHKLRSSGADLTKWKVVSDEIIKDYYENIFRINNNINYMDFVESSYMFRDKEILEIINFIESKNEKI